MIMWLNLDMAFPPKETSYMFWLGGFFIVLLLKFVICLSG